MATLIYTNLHCPEAQNYADLSGIRYDLEDAKKFANRLIEIGEKTPFSPDWEMCEALTISCLIKYARCFATGVRQSLLKIENNILKSLSPEMQADHEVFRLWRDKNIAHSIDECEENQPHARYYKEKTELGFLSIGCSTTALKSMSTADARSMLALVDAILLRIDPLIKREAENLHAWTKAQSMQDLIDKGDPHVQKPSRKGHVRKHNS